MSKHKAIKKSGSLDSNPLQTFARKAAGLCRHFYFIPLANLMAVSANVVAVGNLSVTVAY